MGKYLASQSADKTLRVWRTSDWVEEASVSEPFEECGGTTHVLRLDWSPDGELTDLGAARSDNLHLLCRAVSGVGTRHEWRRSNRSDTGERRLEV